MEQIIMAYLNCPYCPSQAYLARDAEHSDMPPLEKYRCGSGKHVFYVEPEKEEHADSIHGRCS
jgi:hypothetical protein